MKIYVIGSVTKNGKDIKKVAETLESMGNEARYVKKSPDTPLEVLIHNCFIHIESWADIVVVVPKSITNGVADIGDGTLYEMEHARSFNKTVLIYER